MRRAVFAAIFFLSGSSALIFETLWLRVSGIAFGNSVWAAALILSSFMAGLALGGLLAALGRLRVWRPLHVYACLEAVVAVLGCTLVFTIPLLGGWLRPLFGSFWDHQEVLNALRFGLSFLILLVPATAMGLTLPVAMADPILRFGSFHRSIGLLYGSNTLGAVAGALLAEGVLVRSTGLFGTALVASAISLSAALIALFLSWRTSGIEEADGHSPDAKEAWTLRSLPWRLLATAFGTGLFILCLEIAWFRLLHLYVASTAIVFSVMLAVMLAGLGAGGLLASALHARLAKSSIWLPILLLLAALVTTGCYYFFPGLVAAHSPPAQRILWSRIIFLSLELIFPAALVSGVLLPTIAARIQEKVPSRLNATGFTLLFNTIGAAFGPLLASFVFLPAVGLQTTLLICAGGYLFLALLSIEFAEGALRRPGGWLLPGLVAAASVGLFLFPQNRAQMHLANAREPYEVDGSHLLKHSEGSSDTLQLLENDFLGRPYYYRLLTNGFSMSATHPRSQRYMRLFAYLPLALRPGATSVLQLCYGVGVTADAFVQNPSLERIDIVDTSREVFALAPYYKGIGEPHPLQDKRVRTFIQDGRFYLQVAPRKYDIITGEPPPLKVAGTVNLYTEEFFRLMKGGLEENGIASFWLPIYQLKVEETKAILKAFHNAFPNASVWASSDDEWIMLGINGPGAKLSSDELGALWRKASTRRDLAGIGLEVPAQLPALFVMDGAMIDELTGATNPLTDNYPKRLGDDLPELKAVREFATPYLMADPAARAFRTSEQMDRLWPAMNSDLVNSAFILRETRYLATTSGSNWLAELDFYLRSSSLTSPVLEVMNSDPIRVAIAQAAVGESDQTKAEAFPDLVAHSLARREYPQAIALLEEKEDRSLGTPNDLFLLIYLYCLNGQVDKAETLAATHNASIHKDWFVKWLWGDLQAEFGFRPPA